MSKVYLRQNVFEATTERFDYIFQHFENIYVSFSGGKDSGLLFNLLLDYMEKRGIKRKIGLFHQDFEAQYTETTNYVERTFREAPEFVERFWCCFPMAVENSLSVYEPFWYTWDADKPDIWARPMPKHPYVYSLENNPFGWYRKNMLEEDFHAAFSPWYREHCGGGSTVCLLGIRSSESLNRYRAITKKVHMHGDKKWTMKLSEGCYSASPIYDWEVEDVWTANGKFGYDYNRLYDLFYKAGVPMAAMRVASPFLTEGRSSLNTYRIVDAEMWAKLVGRVNGANFGSIYGGTHAVGYRNIKLPEGHTWETYTRYLLQTLPESTRQNYERIFDTSMKFWREKGGGMPQEVIEEVKDKGYGFKENGASPWSKSGKTCITIDTIPDDTDDIYTTNDLPSWKRMCYCILTNDYTCKRMGFAPTKEQQERINGLKKKYASIARGGRP